MTEPRDARADHIHADAARPNLKALPSWSDIRTGLPTWGERCSKNWRINLRTERAQLLNERLAASSRRPETTPPHHHFRDCYIDLCGLAHLVNR
jgi:hypothetical protein